MYKKIAPPQWRKIDLWSHDEFVNEISKIFVFSEETASVIYNALDNGQNAILHGPGGYAKSDIVRFALQMVTDPATYVKDVFITACGPKMDASQFIGYKDLAVMKATGELVSRMEKTMFVAYQYALLDELFAAPNQLILFLRDAATAGSICVDGVCYTNRLQSMFGCTNVSPESWIAAAAPEELDSRKALVQRYMFRKTVQWSSHTADDFDKMFQARTGSTEPVWAEMCAETFKAVPGFSPRTAMIGLEIYRKSGLAGLCHFDELPVEIYQMWQKTEKTKGYITEANRIYRLSLQLDHELPAADASRCRVINAMANKALTDFDKLKIPPSAVLYEKIGDTRKRLRTLVTNAWEKSEFLTTQETKTLEF